ncbi:MAG: hypothetical protein AB7P38_14870 [Solirubrobacterales bacterium]
MVFALKHPLRRRLLVAYAEGVCSPTQVAQRQREDLHLVAYHSRALSFFGVIELVETRPSRGSTQHFYTANDLGRRALELAESSGMIDGDEAQPG